MFALIIVSAVLMSYTVVNNDKLYEISKNIEIFVKVYKELNANYVDDIDPGQLMRTGIDAMVNSLDPYTNYISESQVESYRISAEGKYDGIGASVKKIGDYITIVEPYAGSPLVEAGIEAGDQVIEVNGESTKGKTTEEVTQFVRGVPGTTLKLKVKQASNGQMKTIDLERGAIDIPNVPYSGIIRDNVGYISLTTFTPNASKNIRRAIKDLKKEDENLQGLILDLRDNGGGLLREAISICNLFVNKGEEVVFTRGKVKERDQNFSTQAEPLDTELPLVVLINKKSASASEIVSGVMQDLDRGVIMGQRSYGKGLVQNTKDLGYNSRVKLTTSKYYIPSGRCIQSIEYEDGEPVDIPDHKRSSFKTKNGRPVLDGGGVTPDVALEAPFTPVVLKNLAEENVIFNFTTDYLKGKTKPDSIEMVKFNDFEKFVSFVNNSKFKYETETEKKIDELKETIEEERLSNELNNEFKALQTKINAEKEKAIRANERAIVDAIQKEMATRYFLQEGKAFQKLSDDSEIEAAIDLVLDENKYNSILKK